MAIDFHQYSSKRQMQESDFEDDRNTDHDNLIISSDNRELILQVKQYIWLYDNERYKDKKKIIDQTWTKIANSLHRTGILQIFIIILQ